MISKSWLYRLSLLCTLGASLAVGCSEDSSKSSSSADDTSACDKCTSDQVCQNNTCVPKENPCDKCTSDQVCQNNKCVPKENPCDKCSEDEKCENNKCVPKENPCDKCSEDEKCENNTCVPNEKVCTELCSEDETCVNGECKPCSEPCGEVCCSEGLLCDTQSQTCSKPCSDGRATCGGACCLSNEVCDDNWGCLMPCGDGEITCEDPSAPPICCSGNQECLESMCVDRCDTTDRCNFACCPSDKPVCDDNQCKIACDASTSTRCGENEELCCDNAVQLCMYNKCVPFTKTCTKSSQCSFDEFCETEAGVCIKEDEVPSTCQVIPSFDKFKALKQWHWPVDLPGGAPSTDPTYIRVIVMPMAANLTDDNGDGVVDENDIPDVVFGAYSTKYGPDTQAPTVLRIISGDDGREIASSAPRYWTYPIDAAIGDVDGDGHPDIVAGTNNNRSGYANPNETDDYLEVLTVVNDESSKTGYSLKTNYKLKISKGQKLSFISIADLDGDGAPEILSNGGVASVVTNEDGTKQLAWRKGCENKSIGYPHAADLDADGIMEIVTSGAIYDDHCTQLTTVPNGGYIAVADLMPSGADAGDTGELVPEIAHTVNGYNGGNFYFTKIYKTIDGDGVAHWSTKSVWNAPIPVDKTRDHYKTYCAGGAYTGHCYSGGGTPVIADFNGDGFPDVGVASRYYYIVYSNDGTPTGGKVLWADSKTVDYSSAVTGSSVFDFEGDGKAEVIYADEQKLHIYSGEGSGVDKDGDGYPDPLEIFSVPNYSATGFEYPIIVDVDNDGSTEIVVASDLQQGVTMGVRAFEDPGGQWVRTRRIWNHHHYHVTNVNEDGSIPVHEEANWLNKKLNSYRQNVQPGGVYNAPNLVATSLTADKKPCTDQYLIPYLVANVENQGSLTVKAGVKVAFYAADANGTGKTAFLGTASVGKVLLPGNAATATLEWDGKGSIDGGERVDINDPLNLYYVIDEPTAEKERGEFVECIETDNTFAVTKIDRCNPGVL